MPRGRQAVQVAAAAGLPEALIWALNLIARPWTAHLLLLLVQRPMRYRDLQAAIVGMSTAVVTERLHVLAAARLARRRLIDGDRGVHYEITDFGEAIAGRLRLHIFLISVARPGAETRRTPWLGT